MPNEKAYFCSTDGARDPLLIKRLDPKGKPLKVKFVSNIDDYYFVYGVDGATDVHVELEEEFKNGVALFTITAGPNTKSGNLVARRSTDLTTIDATMFLDLGPPTQYDTDEIRRSIVTVARGFVQEKSHYLWGTGGNHPGHNDGNLGGGKLFAASMRADSLDTVSTDPKTSLGVSMAESQVQYANGTVSYNTCAGRSNKYGPPDMEQITRYLERAKTDPVAKRSGIHRHSGPIPLFPRRYSFGSKLGQQGAIVWGESCQGKRHFDCVGLVNYCYSHHWAESNFGLDIKMYSSKEAGFFRLVGDDEPYMDADVIIPNAVPDHHGPNSHIAMIYNTGRSNEGKPIFNVVQAASTEGGLNDDEEYIPGKTPGREFSQGWKRYRVVNPSNLRPMHGQFG